MSEQKVRNRPEISVIVPVYRVEKYLNDCIDSILAQTFADFELILVDDGSPDNCPALCDAAAAKDSRIRVIHQKNRGLSGARNAGLDIARGRWAAFVDSDDMLLPQALEKAHSTAEKTGADVVLYGFAFTDENGSVAAYITTGAARPIPHESPARTARCVASEEAMSSPHLPAPKSHHSVGCAREDEAGLCPKATVYGSFHLRFPSRSLKVIMRNRPVDCK